jgi:hypothetical protein
MAHHARHRTDERKGPSSGAARRHLLQLPRVARVVFEQPVCLNRRDQLLILQQQQQQQQHQQHVTKVHTASACSTRTYSRSAGGSACCRCMRFGLVTHTELAAPATTEPCARAGCNVSRPWRRKVPMHASSKMPCMLLEARLAFCLIAIAACGCRAVHAKQGGQAAAAFIVAPAAAGGMCNSAGARVLLQTSAGGLYNAEVRPVASWGGGNGQGKHQSAQPQPR